MIDTMAEALNLAAHDFRVFPLAPGSKKPPRGFHWKEEATTDAARIKEWWSSEPEFNIGVATGGGLVVLDVDVKDGKDGAASLDYMRAVHDLPETFEVETPSGGRHVYLRCADVFHNSVDKLNEFPGIDIRADGGYVVGPGSNLGEGVYRTVGGDPDRVADIPASVAELVHAASAKARSAKTETPLIELDQPANIELAKQYLVNRAPEAAEGAGGDDTTYRVATRCRDYGLSEGVTLELMLEHWNEQKASPPWMPDELEAKVGNAFQYASGSWGGQTAEAEFEVLDIDVGESPVKAESGLASISAGVRPSYLLSYEEMEAMPDDDWLVEGVVPAQAATLMFGKSNTFKSFLAIDLALSVAVGRAWHGRAVKGPAKVIYAATEGAKGVGRQRVRGWYEHYEIDRARRDNFFLRIEPPLMDVSGHVDKLLAEIKLVGGAKLVVLDIFGGTTSGSDTEDTTARAWVAGAQRLIRDGGASVLVVAHTSWSDPSRSRGHTHFWGSYDTRLQVEGDKAKRTSMLSVERHKDSDSTGKWSFDLEMTNGTLVPVLNKSAKVELHFTSQERLALQALEQSVEEIGSSVTVGDSLQIRSVTTEAWFARCQQDGVTSAIGKSAQSALHKVRRSLLEKGAIRERDGNVWPGGFEE